MKALTVRQPYAWAIICAPKSRRKDIENRSQDTRVRGTIAIHAGLAYEDDTNIVVKEKDLVFGAIIGVVDIVDVVTEHDSEWFEGEYGYVLKNPRKLPNPIEIRGQLRFWNVPEKVEAEIREQLELEWFLR